MMRRAELTSLAEQFGLKMITIQSLKEYRKVFEKLVVCEADVKMPTKYGQFRAFGYVNKLNGEHHVAMVMGDIHDGKPVLCRTFGMYDRRCVWFLALRLWRAVCGSDETN